MKAPILKVAATAMTVFSFPSQAEISETCPCCSHGCEISHQQEKGDLLLDRQLQLPEGLPERFSVEVPLTEGSLILHLSKNSIFGPNTSFMVAEKDGILVPSPQNEDSSYLGEVVGYPGYSVSALMTPKGLLANIIRPGKASITIAPGEDGNHQIQLSTEDGEILNSASGLSGSVENGSLFSGSEEIAPSVGSVETGAFFLRTNASTAMQHSTATLRPSRVMEIYEFEIGVEIGSRAFNSSTYNSNLTTAQNSVNSIVGNLDARFLRSAGIKHRLGKVIIRTDNATDPLRDSVTGTGASSTASSSLNAFRNYWNNNPQEVGTTHDLAVYHVRSAPSGLAHVNSVGTNRRYATSGGNGATSWANGTLAHEFGHSWSLGHHNASRGNFYESRPRNNSGSNSAGGEDRFISVMHGSGRHNVGRLSTGEADQVFNVRQGKRNFGDLVPNPGPIPPFGKRDDVVASGPINIDVIANDYDGNNDILDAFILDTVSFLGGTISLSQGTGPGGRNELTYTPPVGVNGTDFFHYTVCDTTGRTDWGAVYVTINGPAVVDLDRIDYFYDLGPLTSIVFDGNNDPYEVLSDITFGDLGFTTNGSNPIESRDRESNGQINGVNNLNRDHIRMKSPSTFHHKLEPGLYDVLFTTGDATENTNQIRLTAEGSEVITTEAQNPAVFRNYTFKNLEVSDGELNVSIENLGFSANITRIVITRVGNIAQDLDEDGLDDNWELVFFGDLGVTSGLPAEDADNDGLTDREEFFGGTSPVDKDSDGDGLEDLDEINRFTSDPLREDSDGDGFSDGVEVSYRSDPLNENSQPVPDGLVAYYSFDEGSGTTAKNLGSAGAAANAEENQGSISWSEFGGFIGNSSLSLDGRSSLTAASPIPSDATEFSISVWVSPNAVTNFKGIYIGRDHPGNWGVNLESGHIDFRFATPSGTSAGVDTDDNSVVADGSWYHVVQTWVSDGSSMGTSLGSVYLNGTLVETTTAGRNDFSQPSNGFLIGDDSCCAGREFDGLIDDLAVFTRALSADEVTAVFNSGMEGVSIVSAIAPPLDQPRPRNLFIDEPTGDFSFNFETQENAIYRIFSSSDLEDWTLLETVIGEGGQYLFFHTNVGNDERSQFYRVE